MTRQAVLWSPQCDCGTVVLSWCVRFGANNAKWPDYRTHVAQKRFRASGTHRVMQLTDRVLPIKTILVLRQRLPRPMAELHQPLPIHASAHRGFNTS